MTPTTEQIEAEITRRWNSLSYNPEGVISRESLRHQVLKEFNVDYTLEQIHGWKEKSAELAKQQAMSFAYWTQMEGYYASMSDFGIWGTLKPDCNTRWTTEEIYNQFIEQQNKEK